MGAAVVQPGLGRRPSKEGSSVERRRSRVQIPAAAPQGDLIMRVGFIGLGLMGFSMACRLRDRGHEVIAYNRTREKALKFARECGGQAVETPKAVGNSAEVVHVMVSDNEAVASVLLGSEGLINSQVKHVIVSSTITPQFSLAIKATLEGVGKKYAEAPVLGSVSEARDGRLTTYVGGEPEDASIPTLKDISKEVIYVGEVPKATALKLAINNLFLSILASLAESTALAVGWGFELGEFLGYLKKTWMEGIVKRYEERGFDESFPTRFPIRLAAKDLRYAAQALQQVCLPSVLPSAASELFLNASMFGMRDNDYSHLLLHMLKLATSGKCKA
jgi:3-hydroxyisobutyrate dehydrogenase